MWVLVTELGSSTRVSSALSLNHLSRPSLLYWSCFVPPVLDDRLLIVLPHGVNVHKHNKLNVVYIRLHLEGLIQREFTHLGTKKDSRWVISALGRRKQENRCEFEARVVYLVSFRPAMAT